MPFFPHLISELFEKQKSQAVEDKNSSLIADKVYSGNMSRCAATVCFLILHSRIRQTSYQVTGIFHKPRAFPGSREIFSNKIIK